MSLMFLIMASSRCVTQDEGIVVGLSPTVEQRLDGDALTLAWTYQAGGPINAAPMPTGEVVITAPAGGPLIALDRASGRLRWQYEPPGRVWERSYAGDGQRIFAGVEGGQLVALAAGSGEVVWQKMLGINVQIAPLVVNETLYVPTTFVGADLEAKPEGRAKLFALSATDGRELWSVETDNYILQTPFYHNGNLYVGGSYHDPTIEVDEGGPMRLYALSAEDGSLRWRYEAEDGFVKAIYATDEVVSFVAYQDFVSGIDAQTGELLWRKETGNWAPSLSGAGDTLYFGSANTVVHALDMNTGEAVWQYNIGGGSFNYLLGAPARVADDLYFLTQRGDIIALNATSGALRWQISTGVAASRAELSISDGWLFLGDGEGNVYAYIVATSPGR